MANEEPTAVDSPNLLLNGTFTAELKNGRHFTYRIETVRKGKLEGRRIVMLLSGQDNTSDYVAFGFANGDGSIKVWNRFSSSEAYHKHAQLLTGKASQHVANWYQSSRCVKCGRMLTDPVSIASGMGPKCEGRK